MIASLLERVLHRFAPGLLPGQTLHRRGLQAASDGHYVDAERWFERAAAAYRRELHIEPLARLRVHQRLARARARRDAAGEAEHMLDIVRSLNRLDRLESLRAPYALMDARTVLSDWIADGPAAHAAPIARSA
jgi:hypothetical protein